MAVAGRPGGGGETDSSEGLLGAPSRKPAACLATWWGQGPGLVQPLSGATWWRQGPGLVWGSWLHPHAVPPPQCPISTAATSGVINEAKLCDGAGSPGGSLCTLLGADFNSFLSSVFQGAELRELGLWGQIHPTSDRLCYLSAGSS